MELTEDEVFKKYAKHCCLCTRVTLLPYEYGWTCVLCGYKVKKNENTNSLKYKEEKKILSID